MTTASTECPPSSSNSVLVVSAPSAWLNATGRSEVIRKSRSRATRSAFGTSCMDWKDDAPRASQPKSWRARYGGASLATSQPSSSVRDSERIGGRESGTRLRYRRVEGFLADPANRPDGSVVYELLQVGSQRHLGGDHQLLIELSIDAGGELSCAATTTPHLRQDLRFTFDPVSAVLLDFPHRVIDRIPVTRKQHSRMKGGQLVERLQVSRDVALRVRDHRAAAAEDEVAGEHRSVAGKPEAEVVRAVSGGIQRGDVESADAHDVAVTKLGITP